MSDTDDPIGDDLTRRIEDGVCWITLNRPDAGQRVDPVHARPDRRMGARRLERPVRPGGGHHRRRRQGLLHRCRPARRTAAAAAQARGCPRERRRRRLPHHPGRLAGAGHQSILDCEKPVIAGVNGTAAGGGMHLALACDLVVMAEEAKFVEVFIRRGIAPDAGGAWILTRLVGIQKAKELFFFGDDVPAAEAYRIGLVNRLVPRADLQATLEEMAGRLAGAPTKAIWVTKWLTNRALDVDRATSLYDESIGQEIVTRTLDSQEGIASFVERRPAEFKGW